MAILCFCTGGVSTDAQQELKSLIQSPLKPTGAFELTVMILGSGPGLGQSVAVLWGFKQEWMWPAFVISKNLWRWECPLPNTQSARAVHIFKKGLHEIFKETWCKVSYRIVHVKLTQGIFIWTEGKRQKQTEVFTDEEYATPHTHIWSPALLGLSVVKWNSEWQIENSLVWFFFLINFMCRRDTTEFLAFPVLKGGKKNPKRKKENQNIFTAQSTAEHQLQQPGSSS